MKNKFICIGTCIILIILVVIAKTVNISSKKRVHQHLANTKEVKTEEGEEFNTHLPIVTIDTDGQTIPGEEIDDGTIKTKIQIYDNETKNNYLTDCPRIETLAVTRIRGASSRKFDKKNYLLKFINEDETKNEQSVMGIGAHDEWVLHGPFLDKTLIRNYMWYNIGAEIMDYAPNVRFCEVFINGEYKGLYVMMDSISVGEERIKISKAGKKNRYASYIIRLERVNSKQYRNLNNFTKYTKRIGERQAVDIIYPKISEETQYINKYIEDDISKFEKALYSFDFNSKSEGYEKYIDVQSFVDYFIINEFTQNYDAMNLSTYIYKDTRGKLKMCMWDFNSACDNYEQRTIMNYDFDFNEDLWYRMLLKDEKFVNKIISRYRELRKTYLSEEYLLNYIDETINYIGDAKKRNFSVWGYTFEPKNDMLAEGRKIGSYEEAVEQLKSFIIKRGTWLDEHIEELHQFSHESTIKKYIH